MPGMRVLAAVLLSLGIAAQARGIVLFNEIDCDTSGVDSAEFIELYNTGPVPADLGAGGYVLVLYNGSNDKSYRAFNLTGTIPVFGYYVIATSSFPGVNFTPPGWPATDAVQNGADAVALYNNTGAAAFPNGTSPSTANLVDAVVYDTSDADDDGLLSLLTPGQPQVNENQGGGKDQNSIQRVPDGAGGALNTGAFAAALPTAGAANGSGAGPVIVPDIATARALGAGRVRIAGFVTVTVPTAGLNDARYQLAVQDSSGADGQSGLFIDDYTFSLGARYNTGDLLMNLTGDLVDYNGLLELQPTGPAVLAGHREAPAPRPVHGAVINFDDIEAELIQVDGAEIASATFWVANANYALTAPAGCVINTIRIEDNCTGAGQAIPAGSFNIAGLAVPYAGDCQIQPRFATDIGIAPAPPTPTPPAISAVGRWSAYR